VAVVIGGAARNQYLSYERVVRKALERAGLKTDDVDIIEANEAFAAQACAVAI
jgi:hypothetical protein